ncbi:MAG: malto-oligosyltrehalose trehalohydrolase [Bauldia sp.]|nr:malto-oligosyltrehalose trehalohydrolase [Bauldia sp.]
MTPPPASTRRKRPLSASRRLPVGAEPVAGGTHFRVWAPSRRSVTVVIEGGEEHPLAPEADGYFAALVGAAKAGTRYRFRLDDAPDLYPDPASRYQPSGPHGPSEVVDPRRFRWSDRGFAGAALEGQVIYELHIGTFTPEGSWAAAASRLPVLAALGVTLIEMMPVAEFPGSFGWGYDGVDLFAPSHLYGTPDDLRGFVDAAHALGLGVILDVVYNHFGPDGNYLAKFAPAYFTDRYANEWGDAINFDGDDAGPVRDFFLANVRMWIAEYHFDGLRLDATQAIFDSGPDHIVAAIVREARTSARRKSVLVVGENEPQDTALVRPARDGGYGLDAVWNDDFHHSAVVAMTGRRQAYYSDHAGTAQEFIAAAKYGFLFQGQLYAWQANRRGRPGLDIPPARFITFIENHDQVANTGHGKRIHQRTSPGQARAMTALMLLSPGTPMLFQGQEFWASSPFLYFADHQPELAAAIDAGRRTFLAQFPSLADEDMSVRLSNPGDPHTFARSTLDWGELARNVEAVALHRDLIRLRRDTAAFRAQRMGGVDGVVLGTYAMTLRFLAGGDDRLLLVNLSIDLDLPSIADPLVAPPEGRVWAIAWSSEDPIYGGGGTPPVEHREGWHLPGHAAIVLAAIPAAEADLLPDRPRNPALITPPRED